MCQARHLLEAIHDLRGKYLVLFDLNFPLMRYDLSLFVRVLSYCRVVL